METAATCKNSAKPHKKKANKHKSRNDFSDVQRIEMNPTAPPVTTIDLLKAATDLDDLSQRLDERLTLITTKRKGKETDEEQPPNHAIPDSRPNSHIIYSGPAKNEVVYVAESGIESADSTSSPLAVASPKSSGGEMPPETKIEYREYESELQMPDIIRLIQRDLSEPYSIYTYRYFIHNWPELCFLAMHGTQCVGAIVCKLGMHRQIMKRGYIAMLAVDKEYRKLKIGTNLVQKAIEVGGFYFLSLNLYLNRISSLLGHAEGAGGRGGARDGDNEYPSTAAVREPGLRAGQTIISLLLERGRCTAAEVVVQVKQSHSCSCK